MIPGVKLGEDTPPELNPKGYPIEGRSMSFETHEAEQKWRDENPMMAPCGLPGSRFEIKRYNTHDIP